MIELGRRVVAQTKLRVFKGITDSTTKIVSVFEPDTRILRRGKVHKRTEFGQMVKVQEAERSIVTDIAVVTEHDSMLLARSRFGGAHAHVASFSSRQREARRGLDVLINNAGIARTRTGVPRDDTSRQREVDLRVG